MRFVSIIALLCTLSLSCPSPASAETLQIQEAAPDRYTVVKGDTLWDIAGHYLKQPWRWPEIWGLNKTQIKDPHWIYPGDVIVLDRSQNPPRLSLADGRDPGTPRLEADGGGRRERLQPAVRELPLGAAISSVPLRDIRAFMGVPLVIEPAELEQAPRVIGFEGRRVLGSTGDTFFTTGNLTPGQRLYQMFRPGKALLDPVSGEVLGYRADYVGEGKLAEDGEPARFTLEKAAVEAGDGDRLLLPQVSPPANLLPQAPDVEVHAQVISTPNESVMVSRNDVVVISRGAQDGVRPGHVLAVFPSEDLYDSRLASRIKLPETRSGLLFVFRTFDRVSYALVVQSLRPINVNDAVRNP